MAGVNADNVGTTYVNILDGATETLNQASKARNKVTQNYEWKGSHIETRLHTARNHAIKFMNDGSTFPVADKEDYTAMKIGRKVVGGSIQVTDVAMATAGKAPQVAVDVVEDHVRRLMENILKFENFFFFRDGTGKVATCKSSVSASVFKVDDARALWDGASYDLYNSTTLVGTVTVSTVASAPDSNGYFSVTLTGSDPGITTGYNLYWSGAYGIAYSGLDLLVDDSTSGTFQNVTMSSFPRWTSYVSDNSGTNRDLDPTLFRQVLSAIGHKTGAEAGGLGAKLSCLGTYWQLGNLDELYESNLRLTPDTKVAGLSTPTVQSSLGSTKIEADSDAIYHKIIMADLSQVTRGVQKKLGWRQQGGQIFLRSDTSPVWTATALEVCEMYITGRNSSAKIEDLNESVKSAY